MCVCVCHTQKVHIWISLHKKLDDLPQHDGTRTINCTNDTILVRISLCVLNTMCICIHLSILGTSECYFIEKLPFKFSFRKSDSNGVTESELVCVCVCMRSMMRDV